MTLPRKLMIEGERTVTATRTHVKALILPTLILLAVTGSAAFLSSSLWDKANHILSWILVAVAAGLIIWGSVVPFLRWYTWTYTLTNKRIVEQRGILTRTGRVIPLNRINDVSFEKNLDDRFLGSGTLVIHDASEQAGLELHDIPHIEDLHRTVTTLVDAARTGDEAV